MASLGVQLPDSMAKLVSSVVYVVHQVCEQLVAVDSEHVLVDGDSYHKVTIKGQATKASCLAASPSLMEAILQLRLV